MIFNYVLLTRGPGCEVQSAMCLAADTCLTADPGVASLILARSHNLKCQWSRAIQVVELCMVTEGKIFI